ncbi:MAG TPA: MBL fold metallo-hydrolase [Gemmataceae bacterium]|nr:MBL fold metallo-hydrolase [Gemmataceae bacterium]
MSVVTPAASVLLSRGPGSREIYAILRGRHLRFFGGFWAFPGGKVGALDLECDDAEHSARTTACRELFEETGILIARHSDGTFPSPCPALDECRRALLAETIPFGRILSERGLTIRAEDFARIGAITTPDFAPVRYATTFFVAHVPPNQQPSIWPGELEHGEWIDVGELLSRWRRGELMLTPPSVMSLELLGDRAIDEAPTLLAPMLTRLASGAMHPIFFAPSVQMIPLKTVALPPSTHTNAYLIGNGPRYLLDPGADDPAEQRHLFELLDQETQAGRPLTAIVLSHHHPDHIGAANACAVRYGVPIWGHDLTARKLDGRIRISRHLHDGDDLPLGPHPGTGVPWHITALHTPGHASGHLTFFDRAFGLLYVGDMLSTVTSIVITPPDGDLPIYLQSLQRLRQLPARMLLPAHGNVSAQPMQAIDAALEHRAKRERQLLEALTEGPTTIDDLTQRLYRGTPEPIMRFARAQVLAGLLKLQAEARVQPPVGEMWSLAPATGIRSEPRP